MRLRSADAIAALLGARAYRYRPRQAYAGVAEVSVYVRRAARGQGAGRLALSHRITEAERRGL